MSSRNNQQYRKRKWDIADAIAKSLNLRSYRRKEERTKNLAVIIRAILKHQGYCCALSGKRLAFPPPSQLSWQTCLTHWRRKIRHIEPDMYARSPDVVRVSNYDGWVPGNIIIIAHSLYELYMSTEGVFDFKDLCTTMSTRRVVVVQPDVITAAITAADAEELIIDEHIQTASLPVR